MKKFSPSVLVSVLLACQLSSALSGHPCSAKDVAASRKHDAESGAKTQAVAEPLPGTTDGIKIKMQPQLQEVNDRFRQIYAETRTRTLKKSQPVIIAVNDGITLIDGTRRETAQVISDKYTLLKSVCHIVLATFVALELDTDQPLSDEKLKQLSDLESLAKKASASLNDCGLRGAVLERQRQLIDMALKVLAAAIKEKKYSIGALTDFCRDSRKLVMQNVDEAVADQLLAVNLQVKQWHKELGTEKWKALNVVVVSGHMPRQLNSNMQYFGKLLKQKREGAHVYYCEGMSEEADALNLVGTHILDKEIAVAFFNDEWRMHRDLLSDGAAKYLSKHPPLK